MFPVPVPSASLPQEDQAHKRSCQCLVPSQERVCHLFLVPDRYYHCKDYWHYSSTMATQDEWITSELANIANKPLPVVITIPPQHTEDASHNPHPSPTPQRRLYECFVRLCQSCVQFISPEDNDNADGQLQVHKEESQTGYEGTTVLVCGN